MQTYTMRHKSQHYGKSCGTCGNRVREWRLFVIDRLDPSVIHHANCSIPT